MKRMNVFIDGSWLFRVCERRKTLADKTETPSDNFKLSFSRLNESLLKHVQRHDTSCSGIGDCYYSMCVFEMPEYGTINPFPEISEQGYNRIKNNVIARNIAVDKAIRAGYKDSAVLRPPLKGHMITRFQNNTFQEKQIDTMLVALIVRSAITRPDDYHVLITGDADIIPAINIVYPDFSQNLVIATTHPDELKREHRHTSFALANFSFAVPTYFLQDYIEEIIDAEHAYRCKQCSKVFVASSQLPPNRRAYCKNCQNLKE